MKPIIKRFPEKQKLANLVEWYAENMVFPLKITPSTKIVSMGSCFAREVKKYLVAHGYNYLQAEADKRPWLADDGEHPADHASCAWERVYNVFTFRNIMQSSFCSVSGVPLWQAGRLLDCGKYCVDLLRTRIAYPSVAAAEADIAEHIQKSREVLLGCEVFIFTLGLVEIWKSGNMVLGCSPFHYSLYPPIGDFKYHVSTFDENRSALFEGLQILRDVNPTAKIILSVSPVHLCATHREDTDILSASCYSKSVLRAVAGEAAGVFSNVFYFSSYEIATVASAILQRDIYPDGHHAGREIIDSIMEIFHRKTKE